MIEVTAVVEICQQVGPEDWHMKRFSRNFSVDRQISDLISWAENMGVKNATITDIILCDYTGKSL